MPVEFDHVEDDFTIEYSHLTSLKGVPQYVGGKFHIAASPITSLEHSPLRAGAYTIIDTHITNLKGCTQHVAGDFKCVGNKLLTSLEGMPTAIDRSCYVNSNALTSLLHGPTYVGEDFLFNKNQLTSLEHGPTHVGRGYFADRNPLTSLVGLPENLTDEIVLDYNPQLPCLRLLNYQAVSLQNAPDAVYWILSKHKGWGKQGALQAAGELIRAGFKGNARW